MARSSPNDLRAEGPGVVPAKGNTLAIGALPSGSPFFRPSAAHWRNASATWRGTALRRSSHALRASRTTCHPTAHHVATAGHRLPVGPKGGMVEKWWGGGRLRQPGRCPWLGETDAPSGRALLGAPLMRKPRNPRWRPNQLRAEGPGVLAAKGNALVLGWPPRDRSFFKQEKSNRRAISACRFRTDDAQGPSRPGSTHNPGEL